MGKKARLLVCIATCLIAAPQLWAEEAGQQDPKEQDPKEQAHPTATPEAAPDESAKLKLLPSVLDTITGEADQVPMAGCTASQFCIHGGSVSCSSPVNNTCSSSGARCGQVTCGGETTSCPGSCVTAWNCARFCHDTYGSTDGTCDSFGCCVCF